MEKTGRHVRIITPYTLLGIWFFVLQKVMPRPFGPWRFWVGKQKLVVGYPLHSDTPAFAKTENDRLFYSVLRIIRMIFKSEKWPHMKKNEDGPTDIMLCKNWSMLMQLLISPKSAQGGQWQNVFLDQRIFMTDERVFDTDYFRWLYTAFTRTLNVVIVS